MKDSVGITPGSVMTDTMDRVDSPVHVYQEIDSIDQNVSKGWLMKIN